MNYTITNPLLVRQVFDMLSVIETGDVSRLDAETLAELEHLLDEAPEPESGELLALPRVRGPHVNALIRSLLVAAGCKSGEWTLWLHKAIADDAAAAEKSEYQR